MGKLWPVLSDLSAARSAARQGFYVAAIVAAIDFLFGFLAFAGLSIPPFDTGILFDGALFAFVAWRVYRPSRTWSAIGLGLFAAEMGYKIVAQPKTFSALSVVLLLGAVNGVRGAFAYNRLRKTSANAFCIYCGHSCQADAVFCGNCGQRLPDVSSSTEVAGGAPAIAKPRNQGQSASIAVWVGVGVMITILALTLFLVVARTRPSPEVGSSPARVDPVTPGQILDPSKFTASVLTIYCYDKRKNVISQGSGFVIRRDGAVVTDWHVAKKAFSIVAVDGQGQKYAVSRYLNVDPTGDLVVLQLTRADGADVDLPAISVADSRRVSPGLKIYTISAPNGLSQTLSDGLVSAIRAVDGMQLLQITAPVSPGSSGGPVLNGFGEVVGVIEGLIPSGQQLNFAIPIDAAVRLLNGAPTFATSGPRNDREGVADAEQSATREFERGRTALGEKNYLLAARIFITYLQSHPREGAAAFNAALAYAGLNDAERAANFFRLFLTLAPAGDPDIDTAKKWITALESGTFGDTADQSADDRDPLSGRYQLIGSIQAAAADIRLMITGDGTANGVLNIDGVVNNAKLVGVRSPNGQLTLRLSTAGTLTGTFDGRHYAGTLTLTEDGANGPFDFRVQVKY